jgi:hypothetical protein
MLWKSAAFMLAAGLLLGAGPSWAACSPNDRIDGSTANDARQKIAAAGYEQVSDLRKGCDNMWHGIAMKDGARVNVALAPDGSVYKETD